MSSIEIKSIWTDVDGMLQLVVGASNGRTFSSMEIYSYPADIESFAARLKDFPFNLQDEVVWESGDVDPKWYGHMRIRAYVLDGKGHSAIEVLMDMRGDAVNRSKSTFSLRSNPADLNELGQRIIVWLANPADQLVVEWRDA